MADLTYLPFGKQFSPTQITLRPLLDYLGDNEPSPEEVKKFAMDTFFSGRSDVTLGLNTYIAVREYGLAQEHELTTDHGTVKQVVLTSVGLELYHSITDEEMYDGFARHILNNLHGLEMLTAISDLTRMGQRLTAASIAEQMILMGYEPGSDTGEKLNPMRLWLQQASIFRKNRSWVFDEDRVNQLLGYGTEQIAALKGLTKDQLAFLLTYVQVFQMKDDTPANKVARMAAQVHGVKIDFSKINGKIVYPLEDKGFLTSTKTTSGRGGFSHVISRGSALDDVLAAEIEKTLVHKNAVTIATEVHEYFKTPLKVFLDTVEDRNASNHDRGYALEGVTFHICRMLGLQVVDWRKRSADTGYSEVDLIAVSSSYLHFAKYQIQCKVSDVTVDHVDREAGVSLKLKPNVILFISAKHVTETAKRSASEYMKNTNINIVFIDGTDLQDIANDESKILDVFGGQMNRIKENKTLTE